MVEEIERCLLVKPEVFMYKIPPRQSARGHRAASWGLDSPEWTGRLRCVAIGDRCEIRLEDKGSGELFATCPVDQYPGTAVEAVTDSSRYFVICIQDPASKAKAFIGIGFADRSDSFDLNVTLQDHFKWVKRGKEGQLGGGAASASGGFGPHVQQQQPSLDLAFKEGQTIRINIPKYKDSDAEPSAQGKAGQSSGKKTGGGTMPNLLLPPPPGGGPSALGQSVRSSPGSVQSPSRDEALVPGVPVVAFPSQGSGAAATHDNSSNQDLVNLMDDPWGDFASAAPAVASVPSGNWEKF